MANNDNEPRIQLGKYENGVLEIREGFKKLDDESMEGYKYVRKVIFPASLEELDEDVFSETKELEELDFSRVSKLKEIPGDLVSCKTKITEFVIPQGVKVVDDGFLSEAKAGTKIFVPESVKQLGYINGNDDNDLYVYLFASGIDLDDVEADINTLYVLSKDYADYAEKLKDCDSEAKLREMPEELVNFYSTDGTSAVAVQLDSVAQPTTAVPPVPLAQSEQSVQPVPVVPAAVMSTPPPPPIPTSPKAENQPTAPSVNTAPHAVNQQQANNKNMTNNLIPQELDQLIQEYLTDGVLTDKERAVILRKAEGMGLDRDEIDLYLDAQIQKIDQATDAAVRRQKGKTCPYCGGSIPLLTEKCPHCGESITVEASQDLQEILDNLEEALVDMKAGKDITRSKATVERHARKAKMYYGSNPKIQKLLAEIENETIEVENRAKANARKNAALDFITKHKGCFIPLVVILFVFIGIKSCISCINNSYQEAAELKQKYEQQYELDKPKIDEQFENLSKRLDELKVPNKSNYKEMTSKLLKIVWVDISKRGHFSNTWHSETIDNDYERQKRKSFVEMKRAYASQLDAIYNSAGDKNEPDEIRWPFKIDR